ncbi:TPA: Na+/H+ antiporter NhaC family protein [Providencia alcalifaciens]|uniref:Na+/H+ antiporter family protein n=1 Tax=Providencia alcalifaciens 205/92 TaxID=1256988 RepID=A0AAV3M134_9GAMM|nr:MULTISPECIES: Na+/H+ antiporter NhaC family protein [Providencia]EUD09462.1 Na+/H+ antiporter family protein [Providencia alcalifaciens 205/92]MTC17094.1 sodium:proton antiporter [Providencia alcalifaciens]MTC32122.1 sodium:proton antiporter [Providencia alcalifaciens]MTC64375.1 sodium:proton antiporter [Providencia alcalifaciens]QLQ99106.1 sodium:proton antiporter [Providencia alcalifaciens]
MHDYGIWTIITPIVTILLAILTRQVMLSLMLGILVGFTVINDHNLLLGIRGTVDGIIDTFSSAGNTRTIVFMVMIGGIMRLVVVTGGVRALVQLLTNKTKLIKNRTATQLLAIVITSLIFIESSINQLVAGASTKNLARQYGVAPEKMSYLIQTACVSVCSSAVINGWGAVIMGLIGVQISQGLISGEPFDILIKSIGYNLMAWLSLATILFYVFTNFSWGPMKKAEIKYQQDFNAGKLTKSSLKNEEEEIIDHPNAHSALNFFIPILSTVLMVPVALYITGDGDFSKGSGSTSVYWGVMFGTAVSFCWFIGRRLLNIDNFFKELFIGYASMLKISSIMILAFLMGNVSSELNTGAYIAEVTQGIMAPGFSIGFIFIISAIMSLATGTSWGTFAIMIPIGVQLGLSVGMPIEYMIGAAISGSIFGDMTSPISADAIVASMATDCDHIEHIRTQMPYALVTASFVLAIYLYLGFTN